MKINNFFTFLFSYIIYHVPTICQSASKLFIKKKCMLSYIPLNPSVCLKKKGKFSFLKEGSKKADCFFFHLIQCMHLIYQTLKKTNLAELTNKMKKKNGETLFNIKTNTMF